MFRNKRFNFNFRVVESDVNIKAMKSLSEGKTLIVSCVVNQERGDYIKSLRSLVTDKDGNILKD